MQLAACGYGEVTQVECPGVSSLRLSDSQSSFHFFRPVLLVGEGRWAWGYSTGNSQVHYDVDATLKSLTWRFRRGGSFSVRLRFLLFVRLQGDDTSGRWVHLPGNPWAGLSTRSEGASSNPLELLANRRPLPEAVDLLAKAIPQAVAITDQVVTSRGQPSPVFRIVPKDFPDSVAHLVQEFHNAGDVEGLTLATYHGSGLCRANLCNGNTTTPVLNLRPL